MRGRHRLEPAAVRTLRQILATLAHDWPLALTVVLVIAAAIAIGATVANAEPPPPTLGTTSAEIGLVAGSGAP